MLRCANPSYEERKSHSNGKNDEQVTYCPKNNGKIQRNSPPRDDKKIAKVSPPRHDKKSKSNFAKIFSNNISAKDVIYSVANKPGIKIYPGEINKAIKIQLQGNITEAAKYGISSDSAMNYDETSKNSQAAYRSCAAVAMRQRSGIETSFTQAERMASISHSCLLYTSPSPRDS